MLLDIGWPELMLIGVIALVVIGPKDLPRAMRTAGFWIRKARNLSREFQNSVDQMIREAELDEVRQELKSATEFNLESELQQAVDPTGELAEIIKPPELPDYFDETPPAAVELEPELPGLSAPPSPEPAAAADVTPESAADAAAAPDEAPAAKP
jgi:sec-independent protein translocase protein TatB